jgi:hypothetical protein
VIVILLNTAFLKSKKISENNIKEGYQLEAHNEFASNLRPSVKDYDPKLELFYKEVGVVDLLESFLKYKVEISTLQLRGAYSGSSYLSWHRDTHYYKGAETLWEMFHQFLNAFFILIYIMEMVEILYM